MRLDNWMKKKILVDTNEKYNRKALEEYQLNRINELIKYTKENSSFYRDLYKDINKINSLDELEQLPVITKDDVLNHGNKMVCVSQSEISRIVSIDTSGTMGRSKRIYFTKEDQDLTVDFFEQGLSLLVEEDDIMLVMLPYKTENSVGDLIQKSLKNIKVEPVMNGLLKSFKEGVNLIINNKVNSIVGMPIEILALGRYIKYNNLNINIKSILLSADMVNKVVIDEIRKVYDCEVFNHFGMTETGLGGAVDCEFHDGMHIRENDLLMEIVNPVTKERVEDGEEGEILITTLTREAMPLIRYCSGDISSFVKNSCGCKSILKRLSNIKCRMDNRVHIGKNLFISINEIDNKLFQFDDLINYRVSVKQNKNEYILNLEICLLCKEDDIDYSVFKSKINDLILNISRIKKAHEMGHLNININLLCSDEYVLFYNGKRKIICE